MSTSVVDSVMATPTVPATVKPIIPLLKYQRDDVESNARFRYCNWSRQTGKSFTKSLRRLLRAVRTRRLQVMLSAGERQSKELMEKVRQHCQALKIATEFHGSSFFEGTDIKQLEIRLPNGARILGLPANPNTARGFTGDVFLDEFAMHREDNAIWAALLPTVLRGNGEVDVASTPKGVGNMFAQLRNNDAFERSTVTILDAIKDGLDVDIEQLHKACNDERIWRQEFLCEFLDEATAFLTYEMIRAIQDATLPLPIAIKGLGQRDAAFDAIAALGGTGPLFAGYDVARKRDLAVLWVIAKGGELLTTKLVLEISDLPFRAQVDLLKKFMGVPGAQRIAIDATGMGMPIAEEMAQAFGDWRVSSVTFATNTKAEMAGRLRAKVEDKNLLIPDSREIVEDWHSVERTTSVGGQVRYHADRNQFGHADRFWAAAMAVSEAMHDDAAWDGTAHRIEGDSRFASSSSENNGLRFARHGVW